MFPSITKLDVTSCPLNVILTVDISTPDSSSNVAVISGLLFSPKLVEFPGVTLTVGPTLSSSGTSGAPGVSGASFSTFVNVQDEP